MKWNHYSVDLSQFVDKIIWIKLDVYSINGGVIAFDNFNTIGCQEPVSPNNLELTSTGLYSLAGTFSQGIADNYLIVMYPHYCTRFTARRRLSLRNQYLYWKRKSYSK